MVGLSTYKQPHPQIRSLSTIIHGLSYPPCNSSILGYALTIFIGSRPNVTHTHLGHVRPLLALAVRLAFERDDIVLTILIPPNMLDKGIADIDLQIDSQSVAKRIR